MRSLCAKREIYVQVISRSSEIPVTSFGNSHFTDNPNYFILAMFHSGKHQWMLMHTGLSRKRTSGKRTEYNLEITRNE